MEAYIDDSIVYLDAFLDYCDHLKVCLAGYERAKIKLKMKKYFLRFQEVSFVGYVVGRNCISIQKYKVLKLVEWPPPQNVFEVRKYLCLARYYRRFIKFLKK